ncbi:hypothetical protein E1176_03325 [Fulvivirga sp. RKSG066]|uniref:DUF6263 family protein n=1 Tax=Fulvivirga aurantia TaxID=2529383 RepID=UPI0012BBA68C|nr:DUF6263 family protein [Fulvivirga aurantia]MTI20043.1 hypothetical protein [Fulvivirga aurantia]
MHKFFTLLLLTLATVAQAQKYDLGLTLKQGETYNQVMQSDISIVQDFGGQSMEINMKISGNMAFEVAAVENDSYQLKTVFKSLNMAMKMPQGTTEFSSENPTEGDVFSSMLAAIKDQPFDVVMKKNGKVTSVKKLDEMWGKTVDQFEELPAMQKQQIKEQLMKAYGEEAMIGNMEMVTAIYPEGKVKIGDTWTVSTNLEAGMAAKLITEYELVSVSGDKITLKGTGNIATEDKDAYVETNGMKMKYDMSGTMNSDIEVDKNSGWIIEADIVQKIDGDATIKANAQMPNDMQIPMKLNTTMKVTN